jgi:hypothetical protein
MKATTKHSKNRITWFREFDQCRVLGTGFSMPDEIGIDQSGQLYLGDGRIHRPATILEVIDAWIINEGISDSGSGTPVPLLEVIRASISRTFTLNAAKA